jgi:hypothetical protein
MAIVNKVEKRVKMSQIEIIKFQILTYCYFENINIDRPQLELVALLSMHGTQELQAFCTSIGQTSLYSNAQTVRNSLARSAEKGLVIKEGKHKIKVFVNPALQLVINDNILLDYKFAYVQ